MGKCAYCNTTILFGGVREGNRQFCNQQCRLSGIALAVADTLPGELVQKHIDQVHQGSCPRCNGPGPVDVHNSYFIWSAVILTSWTSKPQISCRSCGIKSQVGNALGSSLIGWWGFPWGVVVTPIQIVRNIAAICSPPDAMRPSDSLRRLVSINIASHYLAQQAAAPKTPPPLPGQG